MRILCTGDEFIAPQLFVEALRAELGDGHSYLTEASRWPSEPFSANDEISEFSGDEDRLVELVEGVQLWLTHLSPVSARVVAAADRLRFVGVPRGGPVNVNLAAATAAGVSVAHLPGRNAQAVAEYTIAAMITGPRGLAHSATQMRAGCWTGDLYRYDRTGFELAGADVGLIGLGQIGHRVARLLRAFGARVQAYDPYVDPDVAAETGAVLVDDLITAISDKHIVSMHARITDETRGMLGAEQFASMRTGGADRRAPVGPAVGGRRRRLHPRAAHRRQPAAHDAERVRDLAPGRVESSGRRAGRPADRGRGRSVRAR
jgi:D-3-phosphoglycerate dehydrogenase